MTRSSTAPDGTKIDWLNGDFRRRNSDGTKKRPFLSLTLTRLDTAANEVKAWRSRHVYRWSRRSDDEGAADRRHSQGKLGLKVIEITANVCFICGSAVGALPAWLRAGGDRGYREHGRRGLCMHCCPRCGVSTPLVLFCVETVGWGTEYESIETHGSGRTSYNYESLNAFSLNEEFLRLVHFSRRWSAALFDQRVLWHSCTLNSHDSCRTCSKAFFEENVLLLTFQ